MPDKASHQKLASSGSGQSSVGVAASTQLSSEQPKSQDKKAKIMITGDDILIEYVTRLVKLLHNMHQEMVPSSKLSCMEKFVTHYVWKQPDMV